MKTTHVPYKGGTEAISDTLGGRIAFGIVPLAPSVPLVKSGRLRALRITSKQGNPQLPDVPTLQESGAQDYEYIGWFAMFAPAKFAPSIVAKLGAEVARILESPDVRKLVDAIGNEAMPGSPEELHHLLRTEIETRKKIFGSQAGKTQ